MTISSNSPLRGLDAAPIIYSVLEGHPASAVCDDYIRSRAGWLTTVLTLMEADAVLRKVYRVNPAVAAQTLAQFASAPIVVSPVEVGLATTAMSSANSLGIDLADAVLVETCRMHGVATICTEDEKLAKVCAEMGFTVETPLDVTVRRQIAAWESANLVPKGLARILFHVRDWIGRRDPRLAQDFWSTTGAGSHLP